MERMSTVGLAGPFLAPQLAGAAAGPCWGVVLQRLGPIAVSLCCSGQAQLGQPALAGLWVALALGQAGASPAAAPALSSAPAQARSAQLCLQRWAVP